MVSAESQVAMDNAAKAVREFMHKNGRHDTTVYELVRPAIYHETVIRNEKEEVVTVLDQEKHQTHIHTSLQPITDEETADVQHHERILPVEKRVFEHDDREEVKLRLEAEQAKFHDHVEVIEGEKTRDIQPVVTGEHIHHHVREYIQPIVNKRTVQPHVFHELVLKHEVHHQATMHHKTSVLPSVTMAEFKRQGGVLTGREERFDFFEGEPRSIGGSLGQVESNASHGGAATDRKTASSAAPSQNLAAPIAQRAAAAIPQVSFEQTTSAAPAPPFPIPERRGTLVQMPQPAQESTQTSTQTHRPSSPAVTDASPGAGPAHPGAGGRWSLLPMQFAKSGDQAHTPTRATPGSVMQAIHPPQGRPSVDQRSPSTGRAGSSAADPRRGPGQW